MFSPPGLDTANVSANRGVESRSGGSSSGSGGGGSTGSANAIAMVEMHARLNKATSECDKLRQHVLQLQHEIASKSSQVDSLKSQLQSKSQQLSQLAEHHSTEDASRLRAELEALRSTNEQISRQAVIVAQQKVQQCRLSDVNEFLQCLCQIENALVNTHMSEMNGVTDRGNLPHGLRDVIADSRRRREEIIEYVSLIKSQLDSRVTTASSPAGVSTESAVGVGGAIGSAFSSPQRQISPQQQQQQQQSQQYFGSPRVGSASPACSIGSPLTVHISSPHQQAQQSPHQQQQQSLISGQQGLGYGNQHQQHGMSSLDSPSLGRGIAGNGLFSGLNSHSDSADHTQTQSYIQSQFQSQPQQRSRHNSDDLFMGSDGAQLMRNLGGVFNDDDDDLVSDKGGNGIGLGVGGSRGSAPASTGAAAAAAPAAPASSVAICALPWM